MNVIILKRAIVKVRQRDSSELFLPFRPVQTYKDKWYQKLKLKFPFLSDKAFKAVNQTLIRTRKILNDAIFLTRMKASRVGNK